MQDIVSIIVPVYNVEKYLSTCIDSILNQTNSHWELILVDDGSTDLSGKICDEYSKKDDRIKVHHKKNGGVSSARNYGINIASGKWITFLDSDDSFEKNTIEFIIKNIKDVDILRFGMKESFGHVDKIIHVSSTSNHNVYLNRIIGYNEILGVCGGAYRKDLFNKEKIYFDKTLKKAEDWKVLFSLVQKAQNIKVVDIPLYIYNKTNECSCTSNLSYEKEFDSLKVFQFIYDNVDESENDIKNSLFSARLKLYHKIISLIAILENSNLSKAWGLVEKARYTLGKISPQCIWKSNASLKEKIVDCCSLYRFTFPIFTFAYKIKYRKKI